MGDYYDGTLEVLGWPRSALTFERRAGYGQPYEQAIIASQALAEHGLCPCCELLSIRVGVTDNALERLGSEPVACDRCEEVSELTAWRLISECEELGGELSYLAPSGGAEVEWEPQGDGRFGLLRWTDTHAGGSYAFEAHGILDGLRALGLAYYASDEGYAEFAGSFRAWRPGWPAEREGTCTQDGPVLTPGDWQSILTEAASLEQAGRLAGSWFDSRTEALGLADVQRAMEVADG